MPKMTYQELKKLTPPPSGEVEVKKVEASKGGSDKAVLEKVKKKKSLKDMLSQYANREVKTKKVNKKKSVKPTDNNVDYSGVIAAGNKLNAGTSYTGTSAANANDEFDRYVLGVMDMVKRHWKLPAYLANLELSCHIQLFISTQGKLVDFKVIKSSGNKEYDQRSISAVQAVGKFPSVDKSISKRLVSGELVLAFPI